MKQPTSDAAKPRPPIHLADIGRNSGLYLQHTPSKRRIWLVHEPNDHIRQPHLELPGQPARAGRQRPAGWTFALDPDLHGRAHLCLRVNGVQRRMGIDIPR